MFLLLTCKHLECTGSTRKHVTCQHCGKSYQYILTRHAAIDVMPALKSLVNQGTQTCRKRVAHRLKKGVDPVSCPSCGWLQADMALELRHRFLKKMRTAAIVFICACLGILPLMVLAALWMKFSRQSLGDIDGLGLTLALLAGVPFGGLIMLTRFLLAKLRYPATAFKPRRPIRMPSNHVILAPSPA